MSKVKLTLTIEEAVVTHAKAVARLNRQSLSEMIENFLSNTVSDDSTFSEISTALELRGSAKSVLSNKSDREIRATMYRDKYGI